MAPDQSLEGLRDVAAKAAENAARIAGVLSIVANAKAQEIDGEAMAAGCKLMTWYLSEALRLSGAARQSPALRNALKLSDWLRANGKTELTRSEVMQFGPAPIRQKSEADAALNVLEEHGWLVRCGDGKGAKWRVVPVAP